MHYIIKIHSHSVHSSGFCAFQWPVTSLFTLCIPVACHNCNEAIGKNDDYWSELGRW